MPDSARHAVTACAVGVARVAVDMEGRIKTGISTGAVGRSGWESRRRSCCDAWAIQSYRIFAESSTARVQCGVVGGGFCVGFLAGHVD